MRGLFFLLLVACHSTPPPPTLGAFPDFTLTDQSGRTVHVADLRGQPWVADFIFTRCGDVCPRLTEQMARLRKDTGARAVSFSVDPDYDTPAVLTEYAAAHHADWTFLTGPIDAVADGAKLALQRDPTKPAPVSILHGSHFILVDAAGKIRGYYDPSDEEASARLRADLRALERK